LPSPAALIYAQAALRNLARAAKQLPVANWAAFAVPAVSRMLVCRFTRRVDIDDLVSAVGLAYNSGFITFEQNHDGVRPLVQLCNEPVGGVLDVTLGCFASFSLWIYR
jgi:hypothetical protein